MKIRPLLAWYDLWVGLFWDRQKKQLYVFPVPCLGIRIDFMAYKSEREALWTWVIVITLLVTISGLGLWFGMQK